MPHAPSAVRAAGAVLMPATFVITDNDSREALIAALRTLRLDHVRPWRFRLLPFYEAAP